MGTISHEPPVVVRQRPQWTAIFDVKAMWASLAIVVMWLAVLFDAIFGPDIVSTSPTTTTTVPSAVALAILAFLGTWVVARHGFRRD